jgi:hypothetical protein
VTLEGRKGLRISLESSKGFGIRLDSEEDGLALKNTSACEGLAREGSVRRKRLNQLNALRGHRNSIRSLIIRLGRANRSHPFLWRGVLRVD